LKEFQIAFPAKAGVVEIIRNISEEFTDAAREHFK